MKPIVITEDCIIYNDMPRGWAFGKGQPAWHKSLFHRWYDMWKRCNDPDSVSYSNYKDCPIEDKYHYLSNYIHDIETLENFDLLKENPSKWEVDKDKIDPNNRCYYFEHLSIVSKFDNRKERNTRRGAPMLNPDIAKKSATSRGKAIKGININDGSVLVFESLAEAERNKYYAKTLRSCIDSRRAYQDYIWEYISKEEYKQCKKK